MSTSTKNIVLVGFLALLGLFCFSGEPNPTEIGRFCSSRACDMSIEEKVGQVLMAHFHGDVANEEARTLIQDIKVGGIIYYNWANGLSSPDQVRELSAGLQKFVLANRHPIPLLIAADQEGGVVSRLTEGFTIFPGNGALGRTGDEKLAEKAAFAMGLELRAVGVNMNLAPVVDVNCNPRNPVIGIRSFGDCSGLVAAFGGSALRGYREAQVIATLKHFPGYGDVIVDPHEDLPLINKSLKDLERVEFFPFAKLASSAEAIMTAHLLVPALDAENCSTLSEKSLTYLRETIGFKGVIVADSLVMDGVLKKCHTVDEAAIQALSAGCDLLILGGKLLNGEHAGFELTVADVQRIHQAIVSAVKSGRVSQARLNQAVDKIIAMKSRYIFAQAPDAQTVPLKGAVNTLHHRALAQQIAALAVQVVQGDPRFIGACRQKRIVVLVPKALEDVVKRTDLLKIGITTELLTFANSTPSSAEMELMKQHAKLADVLLICSYNAWKNPGQEQCIQSLIDMGTPVVLIVTRDPLDAVAFPKATVIFDTFSPTVPSIQAVCDHLRIQS